MRHVLFATLLLAAAGCGKKMSEPLPPPPASTVPDGPGSPQESVRQYCAAVAAGDARAVWNRLPKDVRDLAVRRCNSELEDIRGMDAAGREAAAKEVGTTVEALLKMTPEEYAFAQVAHDCANPVAQASARDCTIERTEMRGDLAVVFTVDKAGRHQIFPFVRKDSAWSAATKTDELWAEQDRLNEKK